MVTDFRKAANCWNSLRQYIALQQKRHGTLASEITCPTKQVPWTCLGIKGNDVKSEYASLYKGASILEIGWFGGEKHHDFGCKMLRWLGGKPRQASSVTQIFSHKRMLVAKREKRENFSGTRTAARRIPFMSISAKLTRACTHIRV